MKVKEKLKIIGKSWLVILTTLGVMWIFAFVIGNQILTDISFLMIFATIGGGVLSSTRYLFKGTSHNCTKGETRWKLKKH